MKKIGFFFTLALFCALPALAQKGTKFTFSKTETADDFPLRGKSIIVEGKLIATVKGRTIVDYEIRFYIQKRVNESVLTIVRLQSPVFEKSKKKTPVNITYLYFTKKLMPYLRFEPDTKEGFYQIIASPIDADGNDTGKGIPAAILSVGKAKKEPFNNASGFRQVEIGKFKSKADFEKFKAMLPK